MNAKVIGAVMLLSLGAVSGCATSNPATASSTRYRALETCGQVTGSRNRASPGRVDCEPVGYSFRRMTVDDIRAWGETDLNKAFRIN